MGTVNIDPRNDYTPVTDAVVDHVAHSLSAAKETAAENAKAAGRFNATHTKRETPNVLI